MTDQLALPGTVYDFERHEAMLSKLLVEEKDDGTGTWATAFGVYEGCKWLRAMLEQDFILSNKDPDYLLISEQVATYRKWAQTVELET